MARRLVANVHVMDDDGKTFVFGPDIDGGKVPDWAEEKITNPKAWGEGAEDADQAATLDDLLELLSGSDEEVAAKVAKAKVSFILDAVSAADESGRAATAERLLEVEAEAGNKARKSLLSGLKKIADSE